MRLPPADLKPLTLGWRRVLICRSDVTSAKSLARAGIATAVCLLFVQLSFGSVAPADTPQQTFLVVVLYPEANNGSPGNALADRGIRSTFAASGIRVEVHNEFLDASRFPDSAYQQDLAEFLRRKYDGRKIDLVIAGMAPALDFALSNRQRLFPGVPLIFFSVDGQELNARKLDANVVGIPLRFDLKDTLNLAISLHPETENVFVVVGKSKFDAYWEAAARRAFLPADETLTVEYLAGLPKPELLERVKHLPPRSVIYYLHVFKDGEGGVHVPADVLDQLASVANAPIYSHAESYLGHGIVGGRLFSFEREGKRAAELGLRILQGEEPSQASKPLPSDNPYLFDSRQLVRWGIRESELPDGSVVQFKQTDYWELYKWSIVTVLAFCVIQALFIAALVAQRVRRARAELRFRQAINAAPTGMTMVDRDGKIVLANPQMEKLFGYSAEEMVGQPIELLMPARYRQAHQDLRSRFWKDPVSRSMGAGRELFARRKDGSEFPTEIGLNPLSTEKGIVVLVNVSDITGAPSRGKRVASPAARPAGADRAIACRPGKRA